MTYDQEIRDLVAKWYRYVSSNYCKERDSHFTITLDYHYDGQLACEVEHAAYIGESFNHITDSLEEAQRILRLKIKLLIAGEKEWVDRVLGSPLGWDEVQIEQAKAYYEIFGK